MAHRTQWTDSFASCARTAPDAVTLYRWSRAAQRGTMSKVEEPEGTAALTPSQERDTIKALIDDSQALREGDLWCVRCAAWRWAVYVLRVGVVASVVWALGPGAVGCVHLCGLKCGNDTTSSTACDTVYLRAQVARHRLLAHPRGTLSPCHACARLARPLFAVFPRLSRRRGACLSAHGGFWSVGTNDAGTPSTSSGGRCGRTTCNGRARRR